MRVRKGRKKTNKAQEKKLHPKFVSSILESSRHYWVGKRNLFVIAFSQTETGKKLKKQLRFPRQRKEVKRRTKETV